MRIHHMLPPRRRPGSAPGFALVVASAVAGLAAPARADDSVDLEIGRRDRVRGTLRPAAETESFVVEGLRGMRVKAVAKQGDPSAEEAGPLPTIAMVDATDGSPISTGAVTSTGAKLIGVNLAGTADVRFRIAGDGALDGDYQLDVTLTPQTRWVVSPDAALAPGAEATLTFAAPAGSTAILDLSSKTKSGAPLLVDVTGPGGIVATPDAEDATTRRHRAVISIPLSGEHSVRVRNNGTADAELVLRVTLRSTRADRRTVDLRDSALSGDFEGAQAVFGRLAEALADTTLIAPDAFGVEDLSITIPGGALTVPTVISLSQSESFFVNDDIFSAGSTIVFEPAGTTFVVPATVTLPFDPDAFDDPLNELSIVVLNQTTGEQETIPASSVDIPNSTATFPVSHFSRFQPVSPRARPLRGKLLEFELVGRTTPGFGSELLLGLNDVVIGKGPRTAAPLMRQVHRRSIGWGLDTDGAPHISSIEDSRSMTGTAAVGADSSVTFQVPSGDVPFERARSNDLLVRAGGDGDARFAALLRRTRGEPTRGNLSGEWTMSVFEMAAARIDAASLGVLVASEETVLSVEPRGKATPLSTLVRRAQQNFPVSTWTLSKNDRTRNPGLLEPLPDGGARLRMRVGNGAQPTETILSPVLRGDVLIGGAVVTSGANQKDLDAGALRFVILVRRGSAGFLDGSVGDGDLPPSSLYAAFQTVVPRGDTGGPAPLRFQSSRFDLRVAEDGSASFSGARTLITHDDLGAPDITSDGTSGTGQFVIGGDGRFSAGSLLPRGSLTRRRSAVIYAGTDQKGVFPVGFSVPARPPLTPPTAK